MSCEPSNLTFVLDRLDKHGLIQRLPHPTDRRAKQIVVTIEVEHRRAEVVERLSSCSPSGR